MDNCIFCQIIKGEMDATKIYEDDNVLAFLDVQPVNKGHVLVVPKTHVSKLEELSSETLTQVMEVVQKVGRSIKQGLSAEGYNVNLNNDAVAGQIIPHVHFHVIPRYEEDGLKLWSQGRYENDKEIKKFGDSLQDTIDNLD